MNQLGHNEYVPCVGDNAFDPSQRMGWQDIMSWYHIDGEYLGRIFLAKGISQEEPLGMVDD